MKQLLLQAFNLIRQNPFYATISIIGTAVTIAFVMVVVMIYDFRTMDMAPESDRSDMMYTGSGMTYRKLDHTNQNSGMGRKAFEALFSELPGVKEVLGIVAFPRPLVTCPLRMRYSTILCGLWLITGLSSLIMNL